MTRKIKHKITHSRCQYLSKDLKFENTSYIQLRRYIDKWISSWKKCGLRKNWKRVTWGRHRR